MDPATVGLVGGIGGGVIGLMGGALGTYFSIKNTAGPRERAFMVKVAALGWVAVTAFLAALWFTPSPYRFLWWLPYGLLLPWAIRTGNRRQEEIRREEAGGPHPFT
jgi:fatty acid desaturase